MTALTHHARARWAERFGDRDIVAELAAAKAPTKGRLRHLLKHIPHRYGRTVELGGRFLVSSAASPPAVFVVSADNAVITVYPLNKDEFRLY